MSDKGASEQSEQPEEVTEEIVVDVETNDDDAGTDNEGQNENAQEETEKEASDEIESLKLSDKVEVVNEPLVEGGDSDNDVEGEETQEQTQQEVSEEIESLKETEKPQEKKELPLQDDDSDSEPEDDEDIEAKKRAAEDADLLGRLKKKGAATSIKHKKLQTSLNQSAFMHDDYSDDDEFDDEGNFMKPSLVRQGGGGANAEVMVEYNEPTPEMIEKFVRKKHVRDRETGKKLSYCSSQISKNILFKRHKTVHPRILRLGPGVMSYFYFLKLYAYAFLFFGILSVPSMFLNYMASNNQELYMSFSAGNLAGDFDFEVAGNQQEVAIGTVAIVHVVTDVVIILLFLLLIEYSLYFFKKEQYKYEVDHPNLEQFTIEVSNLPKDVNHVDIANFFERFVDEHILNKVDEDEKDLEGGDFVKSSHRVHDVQLVTTTKKQLTFAIKVADLARDAEHKEAKYVLAQKKVDAGKLSSARFTLILREYTRSVEKLKRYWAENERFQNYDSVQPIKAFVTFDSVKLCQEVIEAFNRKIRCKGLCSGKRDEELYFNDKRLVVKQAVSPALFKWENVEYKKNSRRRRGCAALVTIIFVLIISSAVVFAASKAENIDVFSIFNETQDEDLQTLENDEGSCEGFVVAQNSTIGSILVDTQCDGLGSIEELDEICTKAFFCFCDRNKFSNADQVFAQPVCKEILFDDLIKFIFSVVTGFVVTIFNFILEIFITSTVKFEKDHDRSKEERKLFNRLFVSTYINTALITLVTELSIKEITGFDLLDDFGFFIDGDFVDFTSDWYREVGANIVLIAIFNILGSHALGFYEYFAFNLKKRCFKPISIEDIKKRYLGPPFLLPLRYAQAAVIVYFTLTYSSGIPFLYPLGALALLVAYYVDKFLLLKLCAAPPLYNNEIVIFMTKGFRFALIIHNVFAVVMFSEPNLFPPDSNDFIDPSQVSDLNNITAFDSVIFERAFGSPVILLTLMLVLNLVYQILTQFEVVVKLVFKVFKKLVIYASYVLVFLLKIFTCYFCWKKGGGNDEDTLDLLKGYQELEFLKAQRDEVKLETDKLIGLSSYNILANPLYARRLKLKGNKSFSSLMQEENVELHSTEEVIPLLDKGQGRNEARFIFKREESTRGGGFLRKTKTLDSAGGRTLKRKKPKKSSTLARTLTRKKSSMPPKNPEGEEV